jgi:Skp family chaperone for outer membrane proteins
MSKSRISIAVAFLAIMLSAGVTWADDAKPVVASVTVIVDVQRILQESWAAKSVQKQIDAQRSTFQTETEKEENTLRQAEQDLGRSRDTLGPDAYSEREQQLRQKTLTVERHFESRRKVLDQAFADAKNMMSAALQDIVQAVAHEHGANIVLVKQQVLWADPTLDITSEVLDKLNKKLPQIIVKMADENK